MPWGLILTGGLVVFLGAAAFRIYLWGKDAGKNQEVARDSRAESNARSRADIIRARAKRLYDNQNHTR